MKLAREATPPLPRDREREIARDLTDSANRDEMARAHLPMVFDLARRMRIQDFEELVADGMVGLVEALNRYDPTKGTKFSTYATFWVRRGMINGMQRRATVRNMRAGKYGEKITHPPCQTLDDETARELVEPVDFEARVLARVDVARVLRGMTPREAFVLRRRYLARRPETLKEVGQRLELSRERVRQIEAEAFEKWRATGAG